jgi:hypothetical protein
MGFCEGGDIRNPFSPEFTFWKNNGHSQKPIPSKSFPHEFEFVQTSDRAAPATQE